ncbi:MAG: pentapeptide repeat-containing protein, partial [Nitrososphaerales archaeon]
PSWWYSRGWNGSKGANLSRANLQHVDLRLANLQYANFVFANLQSADLRLANLQEADLRLTDLRGADLRNANLQNARLGEANLKGADFSLADLRGADLRNANLQNANLTEAKLERVDLSNIKNMSDVYLSGAWLDRTRVRRDRLGDGIHEEREGDYTAAKRGYAALKKNFDDLGDYDAASWAYRKEKRMEKLEARQKGRSALSNHQWREALGGYFKFFNDTLVEGLCDYGESAGRVVGWMAALLFIIGPLLFSRMGGFVWSEKLVQHYYELPSAWHQFGFSYYQYFLYTFNVFTTANFLSLQPINDAVKLASGLFAIVGVALTGLLGFIIGHRLRRW